MARRRALRHGRCQYVMRTGPHMALVVGPGNEVRQAYRDCGRVVIEQERGVAKHIRKALRRTL